MSWSDGQMRDNNLYTTSDIALAAYLLTKGFELLGAIDTGSRRKEFGITSTDPEVLIDMEVHLHSLADEYDRSLEKQFYKMIKELHHSLDEAIKRER
jgi:hypothetical protein